MYLSYSLRKQFKTCPRQYAYPKVEKVAPDSPDNKVKSLYGSTVGNLFEQFFKRRLWMTSADPVAELLSMVDTTLDDVIRRERTSAEETAAKFKVDKQVWSEGAVKFDRKVSRVSLLKDVRDAIPRGVETLRLHRLVSRNVATEKVLDRDYGPHKLLGRLDFLLRREPPDGDLVLLDGKGSAYRDKYVDVDQLNWYSMLLRQWTGRLPDRMGFIYWRSEPSDAVDWHPVDVTEIDGLEEEAQADAERIEQGRVQYIRASGDDRLSVLKEYFPTQPGSHCRLCSYRSMCPAGQIMLSDAKKSSPDGGAGVEDVGL